MNWFQATIDLRGPTGTPWQADTIFGHLCWLVRYREGEAALKDFLQPFLDGKPTFLLSGGFPGDLLPRPLSARVKGEDDLKTFSAARQLRKLPYHNKDDFLRALRGESLRSEEVDRLAQNGDTGCTRVSLKNQISRLTGTTGEEGNLFGFIEYWIPRVTVYLKVQEGYEGRVSQLFRWLAETGYGKRKSVGYGAVSDLKFEPFGGFPAPPGANGFVSLSHFVPSANDPTDGRWRIQVKYGKLGEDFAAGVNPFKRPIIMLQPGAVFQDSPVEEFYGRMVTGVSNRPEPIVHYGYALPVAMRLPLRGEE